MHLGALFLCVINVRFCSNKIIKTYGKTIRFWAYSLWKTTIAYANVIILIIIQTGMQINDNIKNTLFLLPEYKIKKISDIHAINEDDLSNKSIIRFSISVPPYNLIL